MIEARSRETLVKYEDPIEVPLFDEQILSQKGLPLAMKKKTQLPPLENKLPVDDILNTILPPREWIENGYLYLIPRRSLCPIYFACTCRKKSYDKSYSRFR